MMRLKRIRSLAVLFLAMIALLSTTQILAESEEKVSLVVGVPSDRCPIFYVDNGELVGIGVDLMRAAAQEAGYTAAFVPVKEATLKDALDNPEYDLLMPFGSAIASTSGKPSIVSNNLIQTPFTLVTVGNKNLPTLNDLNVGMLSSLAAGAETVKQLYPGIEINLYDTMADCVRALRKGEVDALLHNSYVWSYVLQKPSYIDLVVQPSAMFSMDFRAGTLDTPKGGQYDDTDVLVRVIAEEYTDCVSDMETCINALVCTE